MLDRSRCSGRNGEPQPFHMGFSGSDAYPRGGRRCVGRYGWSPLSYGHLEAPAISCMWRSKAVRRDHIPHQVTPMKSSNCPKVFFACDTGSAAYSALRVGLSTLVNELGLELLV